MRKKSAKGEKIRAKYVMGMRSELLLGFPTKNFSAKKVKMSLDFFNFRLRNPSAANHIPYPFVTLPNFAFQCREVNKSIQRKFSREVFRSEISHWRLGFRPQLFRGGEGDTIENIQIFV